MGQGVVVWDCATCAVGLLTKGMLVVMDVVCAPRAMSTAALNVWCFVVTALIAVVVPVAWACSASASRAVGAWGFAMS
jgi:hypothetical protein